jgi:tryptophan synthase alpha chain
MFMTRISSLFSRLREERRPGLIAYITAGDPSLDRTPAIVAALERGGVDLIELGVPFSDPIADGPVIQRASERALKAGTTLPSVLEIAAKIRETSHSCATDSTSWPRTRRPEGSTAACSPT